jgi:hypothetical protein
MRRGATAADTGARRRSAQQSQAGRQRPGRDGDESGRTRDVCRAGVVSRFGHSWVCGFSSCRAGWSDRLCTPHCRKCPCFIYDLFIGNSMTIPPLLSGFGTRSFGHATIAPAPTAAMVRRAPFQPSQRASLAAASARKRFEPRDRDLFSDGVPSASATRTQAATPHAEKRG